jgi:dihydrofolate reductase
MTVTIMAAVARNGVIGKDGGLPWHLPDDLKRFKATTMGHVLVMGRLTYESIGRPLPGRTTVVVTRQPDWRPEGGLPDCVLVASTVPAALSTAATVDEQVFVQGGAQVYADALGHADRMLITWVDAEPDGDTYFPAVDWSHWQETGREPIEGGEIAEYLRQAGAA